MNYMFEAIQKFCQENTSELKTNQINLDLTKRIAYQKFKSIDLYNIIRTSENVLLI